MMNELVVDFDEKVEIKLKKATALVLFEYLQRSEDAESAQPARPSPDAAEIRALWDVSASLESALVEPFAPNYLAIIAEAKRRVTGP